MEVIIKSVDFTAGEQLEQYITQKLEKLERFDDRIIRARVTLEEGQESNENKHCGIRLEVPGYDHYASKHSDSYESATLETIEALESMIRKEKR